MVAISDIEKLRPELLDLSVAELNRRKTEIDMAIARVAEREAEELRKLEHEESITLTETLLKTMTRLYEIGRLSPRLVTASFERGWGLHSRPLCQKAAIVVLHILVVKRLPVLFMTNM